MTDPATLLASSKDIVDAHQLIDNVANGRVALDSAFSRSEYQRATRLIDAIVHPETKQPIFMPCRFSAFLPANMLILLGMLHPTMQSPARSMFWQFTNQTYNVGVNYCNGSASGAMTPSMLFGAYAIAVVSSCGTAYGLNRWRESLGPKCPRALSIAIPFIAVALANIANVSVIRSPDLMDGVVVRDKETGEVVGKSTAAGRQAVGQVAISRVLVPIPLMLFPPIIMNWLTAPQKGLLWNKPKLHLPVQVGILLVMLRLALPLCIAVFPEDSEMPSSRLEPALREWRSSSGTKLSPTVTFNKGL
jgi:sideroflexin-5